MSYNLEGLPEIEWQACLESADRTVADLNTFAQGLVAKAVRESDGRSAYCALEVCRQVFDSLVQDPRRSGATINELQDDAPHLVLGDLVWDIRDHLAGFWASAALFSGARIRQPWDDGQGDQRNAVFGLEELASSGEPSAIEFLRHLVSDENGIVAVQAINALQNLVEGEAVSQAVYDEAVATISSGISRCVTCGSWTENELKVCYSCE